MKKSKLFAMILAVVMMFTLFTACGSSDDKNTSGTGSDGGVVSDLVSDGKEVVSDVESGVESMMPGDSSKDSSNLNSDASKEASLEIPTIASPVTGKEIDTSAISSLDNMKKGWGQGKDVNEKNVPNSCVSFQAQFGSYDAYFVEADEPTVYLTFDEGYENGYTAEILDVLKEKNCPAVFFVTMPYVKENPDLIRRMIDEGHTVGNHTVNHPSMPTVSLEKAANEISELHTAIKEQFQYEMTLFRPPMGEYSEQTLALTQQLGYKSVFWSFAYKDWITDDQPDPTQALEKTVNAVHNGAIYLLHAVSSTNTSILGDFIDGVRAKDFTFGSMH